jgi:hypothetical protein
MVQYSLQNSSNICLLEWDDGAILPADGLLKHMCTVGGDDGAILPAAVLLKLQQPRSTLDNALLPMLHPHDSHRYCATKRVLGDELNLWNQLIEGTVGITVHGNCLG